jgi:hypothetical protein
MLLDMGYKPCYNFGANFVGKKQQFVTVAICYNLPLDTGKISMVKLAPQMLQKSNICKKSQKKYFCKP